MGHAAHDGFLRAGGGPALAHARVGLLAQLAQLEPAEARRRLEAVGLLGVTDSSRLDEAARGSDVSPDQALLALFPGEGGGQPPR